MDAEKTAEYVAFRIYGRECPHVPWFVAAEQIKEKYRERAREFVEIIRELHSPDMET